MLHVCAGESEYVRFVAVLVAYAESDFRSDVNQAGKTFGVFQQMPKYWPTAMGSTSEQCEAFIADFKGNSKHHTGDAVHDAWLTQRWAVPNGGVSWPDPGPGWREAPETLNYSRRLPKIDDIIASGRLR